MYAARLWWMLRFLGHDAAAVLDGGFARWIEEGGAVQPGRVTPTPGSFVAAPRPEWRLTVDEVAAGGLGLLVDARSPERFRGENETIDKVGGHIPGARNHFFQQNLTEDKRFKPADQLRKEWAADLRRHGPLRRGDVLRIGRHGVPQPAGARGGGAVAVRASSRAHGASGARIRAARSRNSRLARFSRFAGFAGFVGGSVDSSPNTSLKSTFRRLVPSNSLDGPPRELENDDPANSVHARHSRRACGGPRCRAVPLGGRSVGCRPRRPDRR